MVSYQGPLASGTHSFEGILRMFGGKTEVVRSHPLYGPANEKTMIYIFVTKVQCIQRGARDQTPRSQFNGTPSPFLFANSRIALATERSVTLTPILL